MILYLFLELTLIKLYILLATLFLLLIFHYSSSNENLNSPMIVSMWSLSRKEKSKNPKLFKKFQNSSSEGHVHRLLKIWQIWFKVKTILNILLGDFATDMFHNTIQSSNSICQIFSVSKSQFAAAKDNLSAALMNLWELYLVGWPANCW